VPLCGAQVARVVQDSGVLKLARAVEWDEVATILA
jgi:hypothetical protein